MARRSLIFPSPSLCSCVRVCAAHACAYAYVHVHVQPVMFCPACIRLLGSFSFSISSSLTLCLSFSRSRTCPPFYLRGVNQGRALGRPFERSKKQEKGETEQR